MRNIILTLMLSVVSSVFASKIGQWQTYMSYGDITEIEPSGSNTYVLASEGLFSYNPEDGTLYTYDKTNILSDAGIRHIAWNKNAKRLVVVYSNSNIDLISNDGKAVNVPDFYLKSTTLDKTINHIYINGIYAYLSTKFGIVKLNVQDANIQDTYQLDIDVDHCYIEGNYLYAASVQSGLYRCDLNQNQLDKSNWQRVGNATALHEDKTNVYDPSTKYWWTTTADGKLTYYTVDADNNKSYKTEGVLPDGPASNNFYRLYFHKNILYGVSGLWSQDADGNRKGEVHVWNGDSWSEFEKPTALRGDQNYIDLLCMDFDPLKEGHVMVGAKSGMYEFQDGKFIKTFSYDNSLLDSPFPSYNYTIVSSLKYDTQGNLWILNPLVDNSIKSISKDGQWASYTHSELSGESNYNLQKLFISKTNGKMWFVNNYNFQTILYSYDYINDALEVYGPDIINQDNTSISAQRMYCTTEDRNGNIWVGTSSGPLYISPDMTSSGTNTFIQHKVPRNDGTNLADYLLSNIDITAIAVDGGNRKWMGTSSNGVFLISDDNNSQIAHFSTDNSPLISNNIIDIVIEEQTGEVFFATDKGLCSYMSDATEPVEEMNKDNTYAYPNPVRPDYNGFITIVGLSYNADIKIVSVNGTLVHQGRSNGGTYLWDGNDMNGKRVASGVYMVNTATESGSKGTVCKIAIIN